MIRRIFLDKCNTIVKGSKKNLGLNPVAELNIGNTISRILIHFDINKIKEYILDNGSNYENISFVLNMTNSGCINSKYNEEIISLGSVKKRANSFDVLAFKLPCNFDEGCGYDYDSDFMINTNKVVSENGSSWFNATNLEYWNDGGVYNETTLLEDLNADNSSIIVGVQHFDNGIENLKIDLTSYLKKIIMNNDDFYGIGLCFHPNMETMETSNQFVSFFTNHTNTFFHPFLEIIDNTVILDDRNKFHLNTLNSLCLFVSNNGEYVNLDDLPSCKINNEEYPVRMISKGVYCADVFIDKNDVEEFSILCDTWSNLKLNGKTLDDIEMEFVTLPLSDKLTIGKSINLHNKIVPQLYGINDNENIKIGDIREVFVDFIEEYSYGKKQTPNNSEFRLYVKENNREIDIFPYQQIDRKADSHSFILNTNDLIPNTYYIDIRIKNGRTSNVFENVVNFSIVSNVTNFNK